MRGRKPKPVEQRRRAGNPGKRPLPEPVVIGGRTQSLDPPEPFPEAARVLWDELVPILSEVGVLSPVDRPALIALCRQWARAQAAAEQIEQGGQQTLLSTGSTGQVIEHPLLGIERAASALLLRFAEQYGLTPVARTRLGLAELQRRTLARELSEVLGG